MKPLILFILCFYYGMTCFGQTGPEKVAAAFCACSKKYDLRQFISLMDAKEQIAIRAKFEEMSKVENEMKLCAKENANLTVEERRRVPEREITNALLANCSEVDVFFVKFREVWLQVQKEDQQKKMDTQLAVIERFVQEKQKDSVVHCIQEFVYNYGRSDDFIFKLIEYYYQVGDFVKGNFEAELLIEGLQNEKYLTTEKENKYFKRKVFVKSTLIELASKYKQQTIADLVDSKL